MATSQRPRAAPSAALLVSCAAAALLLPWWRADRAPTLLRIGPTTTSDPDVWSGVEVVGTFWAVLLAALALVAVAVSGRPLICRVLAVVAGAGLGTAGVVALLGWGAAAPGPWVTAVAGALGTLVGLVGRPLLTPLAAVVAAVVVFVGGAPVPASGTAGPFEQVARLDAAQARSGTTALPPPLREPRLTVVDATVAVMTADGLVAMGTDGHARVLARIGADDPGRAGGILGVAGDRVARWTAPDTIAVAGVRAGDPLDVRIHDVVAAGPVGTDGSLWLQAVVDPPGTIRRLDLSAYDGVQSLAVVYLPVVTISAPPGAVRLDVPGLLPLPGGAVRFVAQNSGYRLERVTPTSGSIAATTIAGGLDPACGAVRTGRDAFLPGAGPIAITAAGGIWFAIGDRLAHLDTGGTLRMVDAPLPGAVDALAAPGDGSVALIVRSGPDHTLWRLPDALARATDLPQAAPSCVPAPPAAGPAAVLVPVGNTGRDPLGVPLDAAGRWASSRGGSDAAITAVGGDGRRVELGVRRDGVPGSVRPDGSGGAWWLEAAANAPPVLVHGRAGGVEERRPLPSLSSGDPPTLLDDLGGRPPLLGTADGAYRLTEAGAVRLVDGVVTGGVVRADGRGWVLADGRMVALDGDRVLGPVIDAGERRSDPAPVAVQLAKGVPPAGLALPRAAVALDARGRAIVVSDGVALAVDDAGSVAVAAQDVRLTGVRAVEGGMVVVMDGTLLRVDLPA